MEKDIFIPLSILSTDLRINKDSVYKLLGYSEKGEEEFISDTINSCINKGRQLSSPSGGYIIKKVVSVNIKAGILHLDDIELNINRIIASQLKDICHLALFVGTIGNAVEKLSEEIFLAGDPFEGYIMNLVGSETAESVAHIIHETIKADMFNSGYSITNRFSPGYCDWDVAEQFKLFNYFPFESSKVKLTASALMVPVKSISGIVGIGKTVSIKSYPCKRCSSENCIYKTPLV